MKRLNLEAIGERIVNGESVTGIAAELGLDYHALRRRLLRASLPTRRGTVPPTLRDQQIREVVARLGNQAQAARELGVSRQFVSRILRKSL